MRHVPVMLHQALEAMDLKPGDFAVDCTVGSGGHTAAMARKVLPGGFVLGLEADPKTLELAEKRLAHQPVELIHANFKDISRLLASRPKPKAVFFDLGLSSMLLEDSGRGFSFKRPSEPLDMRFDPETGFTGSELLNQLNAEQIALVIKTYGEEPRARRIARAIFRAKPVETVGQLVDAVESAVGPRFRTKALHRVFQAIRCAVNDEFGALAQGLAGALASLRINGRLVVISYHSLEDRMVKACARLEGVEALWKKPLVPDVQEIETNPRARSAKLRAFVKKGEVDEKGVAMVLADFRPALPIGLAQQ